MKIMQGWLDRCDRVESPNADHRPEPGDISLLVIHNISLPPEQFGGPYISQLFCNCLDPAEHSYFQEIYQSKVSAHLLIDRVGHLSQFVPFDKRAWHAGVSQYAGRTRCNDFSIGIELEGADHTAYTDRQYQSLIAVTHLLMTQYPQVTPRRIVGHSDIAPDRKTDPGPAFDWQRYRHGLS